MKKMNETAMKAANGGYTFYCVCGHTESGSGFWGEFKAAVRYNTIEQLEREVRPIIERMSLELVKKRPENIVQFMIDYLQKLNGNNSNTLSEKEQIELEHLKIQLREFKEIEEQENKDIEISEGSESGSGSEN